MRLLKYVFFYKVTPFYMGCRESQHSTVFWVNKFISILNQLVNLLQLIIITNLSGAIASALRIWEN